MSLKNYDDVIQDALTKWCASRASELITALNAAGYVIVHTAVSPYKTQEDADAIRDATFRERPERFG